MKILISRRSFIKASVAAIAASAVVPNDIIDSFSETKFELAKKLGAAVNITDDRGNFISSIKCDATHFEDGFQIDVPNMIAETSGMVSHIGVVLENGSCYSLNLKDGPSPICIGQLIQLSNVVIRI